MTAIHLYQQSLALAEDDKPFVLASVVDASGSTPQGAGANAIFEPNGKVHGTLGGGCLEAESRQRALSALDNGQAEAFDLKLDEVTGWDDGLICGGRVRILVNPDAAMNRVAYQAAIDAQASQAQGTLLTIIRHPEHPTGAAFWLPGTAPPHDSLLSGNPAREIQSYLHRGEAGITRHSSPKGTVEIYVEPIIPSPTLVIAGGGHIGQAVCRLATAVGFEVTVIDDRPTFASPSYHPTAKETRCGEISEELATFPTDEQTYIVIVTRGHRHDGAVLAACVSSEARYIGMIGSRRKSLLIRKSLLEEGLATQEELRRVVSPMGLDIGGQSVEEIAVSIVAQLISVRRQGRLEASSMNYLPSHLLSSDKDRP